MSYTSSQLVTIPCEALKPQNRHEDWFSVRLSSYQPDKRRYVILDPNSDSLIITLSATEKNKIDISLRLIGCQIQKVDGSAGQCELHLFGTEVASAPNSAAYSNSTYDGSKREIVLIASNDRVGKDWYEWISSAVQFSSIIALQNQSRQPELMEWYYQSQESLVSTLSDYSSEMAFTWFYSDSNLPASIDDENLRTAVVSVAISANDGGLSFRVNSKSKQSVNRAENIMNGRLVKFRSITAIQVEALPVPSSIESPMSVPLSSLSDTSSLLTYQSDHSGHNSKSHPTIKLSSIQPAGEKLKFVLKTTEDDIILESSYDILAAISWLQIVQTVAEFMQIPVPPRSNSSLNASGMSPVLTSKNGLPPGVSPGTAVGNSNTGITQVSGGSRVTISPSNITPVRLTKEFTANSSAVFTSSTDTLYLLHRVVSTYSSLFPVLTELRDVLVDVWKLLSDIRYNREAIGLFGERLEGIIHLLGDEPSSISTKNSSLGSTSGILYLAGKNFGRLIVSSLTRFKGKLQEIESYLVPMSNAGWLSHTLLKHTSTSQTMRAKLQYYDNDLTSTFNQLYKSISKASSSGSNTLIDPSRLMLPPVVYDMASDIKRSIDAFGGIKVIYYDKAKIRALSRLIQCDASDLQAEIQIILDDPKQLNLVNSKPSSSSTSSSRSTSVAKPTNDNLSSQRIISFESKSGSIFGGNYSKGPRLSEGSYHQFDDDSRSQQDSESDSLRGPPRSMSDDIFRFICCCIAPSKPYDPSFSSSTTLSTTADKYVVKKSQFKNTMRSTSDSAGSRLVTSDNVNLQFDMYAEEPKIDHVNPYPRM